MGRGAVFVLCLCLIQACASTPDPPQKPSQLCEVFRGQPKWYKKARIASLRWGVPIPVLMAVMYQESGFRAKAKPPRTTCLWVFPGPRKSSAYGYAQAKDETWQGYKKDSGRRGADRDDFGDAIDFVGWYCNQSHRRCGIDKKDAHGLYLAYHEGHGGYNRRTFKKKAWLLRVARKVEHRAQAYERQLASCEAALNRGRPCCLWPF